MDFLLQINRKGEGREERKKKKSAALEWKLGRRQRAASTFWLRTFKKGELAVTTGSSRRAAATSTEKSLCRMSAGNFNQTQVEIFSHF